MGKEDRKKPEFARIFDPELFEKYLRVELKEKGDKIYSPEETIPSLHKVIDLHGYSAFRAEKFLENFFLTARQEGVTKVSVITGKGVHSQGMAVLPDLAERMMREFQAEGIINRFYWEKGDKESSGKLIAYLKMKK